MFSKSTGSLTRRAAVGAEGVDDRTASPGRPLRRGQGLQDALAWAKLTYRSRRLRDQLFGASFFGEPAWDIILDCYAAHLEGRRVTVADACAASSVPLATARRYVDLLTERGLLVRGGEAGEASAGVVELSETAKASLQAMFLKLRALTDSHPAPDAPAD